MKIIDLLNMVAEGKEVPESIKYKEKWYKLIEYGNKTKFYQCMVEPFELFIVRTDDLNDTVEIIEEDEIQPEDVLSFTLSDKVWTPRQARELIDNFRKISEKLKRKEDNNKIEKLEYHNSIPNKEDIKDHKMFIREILQNENILLDKINDIIDKINNME